MKIRRFMVLILVLPLALVLAALLLLRLRLGLPARAAGQPPPEAEAAWWQAPPPLTPREVAAQQWLADITYRLPAAADDTYWDIGGSQHGNFSIRYQAAFSGYAAAALGMRTPAYPALTARILSNTVARVAQKKAWRYIKSYWSEEPWFPDPCAQGNVMYTGHLMMLMGLHEALSGDPLFSRTGVDLVWDATNRFNYTTLRLAEVSARQVMAGNGIPCEPGLVFFACNNHPHNTFRLLEGMGYGDWRAASLKWERWALGNLRATAGGGAWRVVYHQKSGLAWPRGLPGFDGWSLLWYAPWASEPRNLERLWKLALRRSDIAAMTARSGEQPEALAAADCCTPFKVPATATISFLAAAARACGDAVTAASLERWLDDNYGRDDGGRFRLDTQKEWRIGVSANRFIALAQANGSDLRAMIRRPLPRDYFAGLLVESVVPDDAAVFQAWRDDNGRLLVELDGQGRAVTLRLRNAGMEPLTAAPEGVSATWDAGSGSLLLSPCRRVTLTVSRRQAAAQVAGCGR